MSWFSFFVRLWSCLNAITEDVELKELKDEAVNILKSGRLSDTIGQILVDAWFPAWVSQWLSPFFIHVPAVSECKFLFPVLFLYNCSKLFVFQVVTGISRQLCGWKYR